MVTVSEVVNTWQEGFANKDSCKLAEFFTDDFQFVGSQGTRSRQETLDWTAAGGSPTTVDNLEVLFENDDNATVVHDAHGLSPTGELGKGQAMAFYTTRDGKISHLRVVRTAV